ncbi:methyltransferase [Actinoallomurus sp. NPDC052308]|uniref:methyltransferase n=1 Tax=Actinoallomurus sp. NPDC052308 TaxID=3155530 RepID=UPI0034211236
MLRLGHAFCEAQALLTAVELGLFTALHDAPATAEEIRVRLGLHGRGLRDLLRLLVALGVLREDEGRFRNSADADRHLVAGLDGYVGSTLLGAKANLYALWDGLTDTLRSGRPRSSPGDFTAMLDDPAEVRRYARMMEGSLGTVVSPLLEAVDWSVHRSVVDVGGCRGGLVGRIVAAWPALAGHVFDLPQLEPVFSEHMAELGLTGKVSFHAGDFFRDPLPRTDLMVFGHVLHNWSWEQRAHLLRAAFRALEPGGVLLVYDRMLDEAFADVDNLVASLIMALVTEEGGEYTVGELRELATSVGFATVADQRLDANETLVVCRKPATG